MLKWAIHSLPHHNVATIDDGCQSSSISDTIVISPDPTPLILLYILTLPCHGVFRKKQTRMHATMLLHTQLRRGRVNRIPRRGERM